MKFNLSKFRRWKRKYQYGGAVGGGSVEVTPFNPLNPKPSYLTAFKYVPSQNFQPPEPKVPEIDKKSLKDLEGHSNDVNAVYEKVAQAERMMNSLSSDDIMFQTDAFLQAQQLMQDALDPAKLNQLKNMKKATEESYETGKAKENTGNFNYVPGKGVLVKLQSDYEYAEGKKAERGSLVRLPLKEAAELKKKGIGRWLSNQEAWNERDRNQTAIYDGDLSSSLGYGYGQFKLNEEIRKAWNGIGKTTLGNKRGGYEALNTDLLQTFKTANKRSDNYKQVRAALEASLAGLDQEARSVLEVNAANALLKAGKDLTPSAINEKMMEFFIKTAESRTESSVETEESYGLKTMPGRKRGRGGKGKGGSNDALRGWYAAASGFGNTKTLTVEGKNGAKMDLLVTEGLLSGHESGKLFSKTTAGSLLTQGKRMFFADNGKNANDFAEDAVVSTKGMGMTYVPTINGKPISIEKGGAFNNEAQKLAQQYGGFNKIPPKELKGLKQKHNIPQQAEFGKFMAYSLTGVGIDNEWGYTENTASQTDVQRWQEARKEAGRDIHGNLTDDIGGDYFGDLNFEDEYLETRTVFVPISEYEAGELDRITNSSSAAGANVNEYVTYVDQYGEDGNARNDAGATVQMYDTPR